MSPDYVLFYAILISTTYTAAAAAAKKKQNDRYEYFEFENATKISFIQDARKSLKRLRKWKSAHQAEVTFVRCLSEYFATKLDSIEEKSSIFDDQDINNFDDFDEDEYLLSQDFSRRRRAINAYRTNHLPPITLHYGENKPNFDWASERGSNELSNPSSNSNFATKDPQIKTGIDLKRPITFLYSISLSFINFFRKRIYKMFLRPIWYHKLVACPRDYLMDKFWAWVDAAPD